MGQLALAIGGAAIGFATGGAGIVAFGMTGAQLGWAAGSIAGSLLFPPKLPDGPRIEDRSVQSSALGQPIPRIYGTDRTAGNLIWSTDLLETETEQSGKGGPTYSTFSYRASFAVAICDTEYTSPIVGIRRAWADGRLIYDASEANTGPRTNFTAGGLVFYTGTETQEPDPTIVSYEGHAPAYRGQAYAVFTDLQLEQFGNRIPSITWEVVQAGSFELREIDVFVSNDGLEGRSVVDPETGFIWTFPPDTSCQVYVYDPVSRSLVTSFVLSSLISYGGIGRMVYVPTTRTMWFSSDRVTTNAISVVQCDAFQEVQLITTTSFVVAGYNPARDEILFGGNVAGNNQLRYVDIFDYQDTIVDFGGGPFGNAIHECIYVPDYNRLVFYSALGSDLIVLKASSYAWEAELSATDLVSVDYGTQILTLDSVRSRVVGAGVAGTGGLIQLIVLDVDTLTLSAQVITGTTGGGSVTAVLYHAPTDTYLVAAPGVAGVGAVVYQIRASDFVLVGQATGAGDSFASCAGLSLAPGLSDRVYTSVYNGDDPGPGVVYLLPYLATDLVPLADVVTSESAVVGLSPSDIDVASLAGKTLSGFSVSGGGSVRSNLEQLMMAFTFDAVESSGVLKFVSRDAEDVIDLDDVDVAAHADGQDPPTPVAITRADEQELARKVTIRYKNPAADYQPGAQTESRLTGRAVGNLVMDLAVVMTDDQAKQLAAASLYSAWVARNRAMLSITTRNVEVEPTDIVRVGGNRLRILGKTDNGGVISLDASLDSGVVTTQSALGAVSGFTQQTIPYVTNSTVEFLDIPMLRDQDDDAGYYVAASGYSTTWPGAALLKSSDGSSYAELLRISTPVGLGVLTSAIGAFSQNTFDETSVLTVSLRNSTLSSSTRLGVLDGDNPILVGNEIMQFRDAVLNMDGTWTLTGLLRGRKGSDPVAHVPGERFVFLSPETLRRPAAVISEIDVERLYKIVTIGSPIQSALVRPFTNTAKGLCPLSPVHFGGGRNAALDVLMSFKPRTRLGGEWRDYVDAFMAEATEAYEIDVFTDNTFTTVARVISISTPSATYTVAQQITDFGSAQANVYTRAYQISAIYGRGEYAQATI